jgi:hypothetical protein
MISKGAQGWDRGLRDACHGGHLCLAELMIEKGATAMIAGVYYPLNINKFLNSLGRPHKLEYIKKILS